MVTQKAAVKVKEKSFDNIINFRDVGKTINDLTGKRVLNEGLLFRSARPDNASLSDRASLKDIHHITTIIDLRTKSEHIKQQQKRNDDLKAATAFQSSPSTKPNDALNEPVQIPGIAYLPININGKGFERSLLKKLHWFSFLKLIILMLLNRRMQAISILGREVMTPRGLIGLGQDTLLYCGAEIGSAIHVFGEKSNYPILYHCTQGKDRTGLITCLLLFLLGEEVVAPEAIEGDYGLSAGELEGEREGRLREIREMGFSDGFAECPEGFVEGMREYLVERWGGVEAYLVSVGVGVEEQRRIMGILKAES